MPKKVRKVDDRIEVKDSVSASVTRRVIIPLNFANINLKENYFVPRFKKILKGESIEWVNLDNTIHHLLFYRVRKKDAEFLFELGPIRSNESMGEKFDFNFLRIDYYCKIHENEMGTIVIYQKPENQMTNAEQYQFLDKIFGIKPPPSLTHIGSE